MPMSLIVVDDFLEDPMRFRQDALRLTYPDLQGNFPGRNSLQRLELGGLAEAVSHLAGERLKPLDPPMSHAKCRITLAADIGLAGVHTDPGVLSGILYLSKPEDCRGGTEFFRHRATNSDHSPRNDRELREMGYASYDAVREQMARDTLDPGAWEKTMDVPMRFNRLVLLRPWLWHTAGPGFGDTIDNGRLIYVMFFQPAGR